MRNIFCALILTLMVLTVDADYHDPNHHSDYKVQTWEDNYTASAYASVYYNEPTGSHQSVDLYAWANAAYSGSYSRRSYKVEAFAGSDGRLKRGRFYLATTRRLQASDTVLLRLFENDAAMNSSSDEEDFTTGAEASATAAEATVSVSKQYSLP